jgi:PAS domain S-box-containing protein
MQANSLQAPHPTDDIVGLVNRYRTALYTFAYRFVGNRETAEDIVQETFIRCLKHRQQLLTIRYISTWLFTIAGNLAKSELRRDMLLNGLEADIRQGWSEGRLLNFRVVAKDGTIKHLEVNRRLVFKQGQLLRNEGVARDITSHKVLEETLERYRQIITNSLDAVIILDSAGIFLEQNPAHQHLFGYSDAELQGQTPAHFSNDELFCQVTEVLHKEGSFSGEVWGQSKDGERIPVELSAFLIKDEAERILCQVGFARDLRARKREESRYRTLVETPNYVVIQFDPEGKYLYVSPQVKDWLGYTPEQFYQNPQIARHIVHPDDVEKLEASFAQALTGATVPDLEFRWKSQDDTYRWALRSIFPILGTDGQIETIQTVIHDVTEKNEALVELEHANCQLREAQAKLVHAEKMAA